MKREEELGRILADRGLTITVAESCTGGLISSRITDVAGASAYFTGAFITYSNRMKEEILSVPPATLIEKGAVSEETALAMARGAMARGRADIALSVTGIAGPEGGTPEKPVGLVWFGLCAGRGSWARRRLFPGDRAAVRNQAADEGIQFVLDYLAGGVA